MTESNLATCPSCGRYNPLGQGLCLECQARGEKRRQHHRRPGAANPMTIGEILACYVQAFKPLFYLVVLCIVLLSVFSTYYSGCTLTMLLPRLVVSPLLIVLTAASWLACTSQTKWPRNLPWQPINALLALVSLPVGLPALALLLIQQSLAPSLKLMRNDSPLWGWNQLNLALLPLYFGLLTLGSLS